MPVLQRGGSYGERLPDSTSARRRQQVPILQGGRAHGQGLPHETTRWWQMQTMWRGRPQSHGMHQQERRRSRWVIRVSHSVVFEFSVELLKYFIRTIPCLLVNLNRSSLLQWCHRIGARHILVVCFMSAFVWLSKSDYVTVYAILCPPFFCAFWNERLPFSILVVVVLSMWKLNAR